MPGVFISYRRDDASPHAGRLYDHLSARFGADRVFMDLDTIRPGDDFVQVISNRVAACDVLIAVIGRNWLAAHDSHGRRRLDDPRDYVRIEIASALQRNVRVIPALFDGASMPNSKELPPDLAPLARRNAIEISNSLFRPSVDRLIQTLEETVRPNPLSIPRLFRMKKPPASGAADIPRTGRTLVPALRLPTSLPESFGPMLGAGTIFFFLQLMIGQVNASYHANIVVSLAAHSIVLFVLMSARFFTGAMSRETVLKLTGCWLAATLLKIFIGSTLIDPWPTPPYVYQYSIPPGSGLVLVIVEAIAALIFGAFVRFVRPVVPWRSVFMLAQFWGFARLVVWLTSNTGSREYASPGMWALYDAVAGASVIWLARRFTRGLTRRVL